MLAHAPGVELSIHRMATLDELLATLEERRRELADTLDKVDAAIRHIKEAKKAIGEAPPLAASAPLIGLTSEGSELSQRERGALSPTEIAQLARDVLLSIGRPLKRGQLLREMIDRDIPLAGKDKSKNLGTILWRHAHMFVHIDGLGYWPKDVPLEGVYTPE